jgi:hypothetical protein
VFSVQGTERRGVIWYDVVVQGRVVASYPDRDIAEAKRKELERGPEWKIRIATINL